ncbi:MAG: LacI family DNA-binding transcriptional regulator [Carbonactinosporaceae bacterium]
MGAVTGAEHRAATMAEVARHAGVSASTVSRALQGTPNVSPRTRERVLRAAAELSYVVSPVASHLASGRTRTVAIVVPFVSRWYYGQVIAGAEPVLCEAGMDVLLYNLRDAAGRERFFARPPLRRRVDAVLLVLALSLTPAEIAALRGLDVPVCTIGPPVPGMGNVRIDDVDGGRKAVRHLVNLGHTRIGFIAGNADDPMGFSPGPDRRRGYRESLAGAGLPGESCLEVAAPWGLDGGAHAMAEMLSGVTVPTAVFTECDEMAIGALRTIRRFGLRCPEDVSVVGFDDHAMADLIDLTTVRQPVRDQGALAASILLDMLAGPGADPPEVVQPTRLVARGTTGPPRHPLLGSHPAVRHHGRDHAAP